MIRLMRLGALVLVLAFSVAAGAESRYTEKLRNSQTVLDQMINQSGQTIPLVLFRQAHAIAIFPGVVRAGFIFGGRYGEGVVLTRNHENKWSSPAFFTLAGGSWGLQAGVQAADIILFVMNERGLQALLKQKLTLGADMSVAAGPNSVNAAGEIDIALKADIYSYVRSRGLFAGIAVSGARMAYSPRMNREYYTQSYTVDDIIVRRQPEVPRDAAGLVERLNQLSSPAVR